VRKHRSATAASFLSSLYEADSLAVSMLGGGGDETEDPELADLCASLFSDGAGTGAGAGGAGASTWGGDSKHGRDKRPGTRARTSVSPTRPSTSKLHGVDRPLRESPLLHSGSSVALAHLNVRRVPGVLGWGGGGYGRVDL
jgi:hypothetical protein